MRVSRRWVAVVGLCFGAVAVRAQIDPVKRDLFQFGYNAAFEGHSPLSAYAFFYHNQPEFLGTNMALRLAVAPTYVDSELGLRRVLGEHTDLAFGLAGGGFADSYNEIKQGQYAPEESFDGHGGEASVSLYHLFNPGQRIPLNGVLRGIAHYTVYDTTSRTAPNFRLPEDMGIFHVRGGLRWGGREPTLFPALAMELSAWYQGEFRTESDVYGFGDRKVNPQCHFFWGTATLAYTLPEWHHTFEVSIKTGTSIEPDRLSTYRLGGFLPMVSEFPLSLPGYYYQEISARNFMLASGTYILPLEHKRRWNLEATAATATVAYLPGLEQPGNWISGAGAGVFYTSPTWRIMVGYGYGIDAIRTHGRGAHSIGLLFQFDLGPAKEAFMQPEPPGRWRGLERILGVLGS